MMATDAAVDAFSGAKAELAFAYEHVPFYQAHLASAGLTPQRVREPEDFRRVPPTRKRHYREHFPAGVLARGTTLKDPLVELPRSSGRTGDRLTTARSITDRQKRTARTLGLHPFALARANSRRERTCVFGPPNCSDVDCANPLQDLEARRLPNFPSMLALPVAHDLVMTPTRMVDQAIGEIAAFGATTLIAAGSHTSFLIRQYIARDLPPPPFRFAFSTFTQLTELARAHWREFFGRVPFVNVYNLTEFGSVAAECPQGRLHLNPESYYLELLREDGTPSDRDELGELFITSIGDRLCPHIRYGTGDYFRLLGDCTCGSTWPVVSMEGRRNEFLAAEDGSPVTPGGLSVAVGAPDAVQLYQVTQDAKRRVRIGLLTTASYRTSTGDDVVDRLRGLFGDLPIRAEVDTYLPCERSGKFLYCRAEATAS
jgi:phenylacetate-CoA ligase